jgi:hypothetical protein
LNTMLDSQLVRKLSKHLFFYSKGRKKDQKDKIWAVSKYGRQGFSEGKANVSTVLWWMCLESAERWNCLP